jgi:hypothetical protein
MKIAVAILGCICFIGGCLACILGKTGIEILDLAVCLGCLIMIFGGGWDN